MALAQAGIGRAARHGTLPRVLRISRSRARALLAGGVVVALIAAVAAGAPLQLSHAWNDFKHPSSISQNDLAARFGTLSGNGRYDYWKVAVKSTGGHLVGGSGPGTSQRGSGRVVRPVKSGLTARRASRQSRPTEIRFAFFGRSR